MYYTYRSKNQHPQDFQVLKKLGIVDRSAESFSEDDELMKYVKNNSQSVDMFSESEEEILFEKDSFIENSHSRCQEFVQMQNQTRSNEVVSLNRKTNGVVSWHLFLLHATSFILGLCFSVLGSTFSSFMLHGVEKNIVSLMLILTLNSFGVAAGVCIGEYFFRRLNAFCVLTLSSLLGSIVTIVIPWSPNSVSIHWIFVVQGCTMGLMYKGIHHIYYVCWRKKYQTYLLMYFSMTIGCALSPLFVSTFMSNYPVHLSTKLHTFSTSSSILSSLVSEAPPHLMHKRESSVNIFTNKTSNFTDFQSLFHNETDIFNVQNVTTYESTTIKSSTSTTTKVRKPMIADGTNIDPPKLRADNNQPRIVPSTSRTPPVESVPHSNASTMHRSPTSPNVTTLSPRIPIATSNTTTTLRTSSTPTSFGVTTLLSLKSTLSSEKFKYLTLSSAIITTDSITVVNAKNFTTASNGSSILQTLFTKFSNGRNLDEVTHDVDYVYVWIALCALALFLLFFITCCCSSTAGILRRKFAYDSSGLVSEDDDFNQLTFRRMWIKRSNIYAGILVAGLFSFLSSGFENLFTNSLIFYNLPDQKSTVGLLCLIVFWCGVAVSRFVCGACYKRLWRNSYLLFCFCSTFLILGSLLVFFANNQPTEHGETSSASPVLPVLSFLFVGLFTGFLSPNLFCWFSDQLSPTVWFGTYWIVIEQMARAFVPLLAASFADDDS
uniref:Uncharacterized protein n=1 Tax=Romanomermis culicivorax TaxID=13658 RepID=A0A915KA76_ROMCU